MTVIRFIGALLAWGAIGLMHSLTRYIDMKNYDPSTLFSIKDASLYMLSYAFWVIITLVLLHWLQRLRFPFQLRSLFSVFFLGLFFWIPIFLLMEFSTSTLISDGTLEDIKNLFIGTRGSVIFFYALVYALTFAVCLGIVLSEKTKLSAKANASLLQKQTASELLLSQQTMQLMQSQLSPHFLFNCLGAISGLARTAEKQQLIAATARVGDLLRFIISNSSANLITIEEELNFVGDYVALQKLRFGNRFDFVLSVYLPETQVMCPPFTIQPLIENAFCHAVEVTDESVTIELTITHTEHTLIVLLRNNIAADKHLQTQGNGTGLVSLETRLQHVYQNEYKMDIKQDKDSFNIELQVPLDRNANG